MLSPDGPIQGVQMQGERKGRNSCDMRGHNPQSGFLPEVVLRMHEVTVRQTCGPSLGGPREKIYVQKIPRRVETQAGGPGQTPAHAKLPSTTYSQYKQGGRLARPPPSVTSASSSVPDSAMMRNVSNSQRRICPQDTREINAYPHQNRCHFTVASGSDNKKCQLVDRKKPPGLREDPSAPPRPLSADLPSCGLA